MKQTKEILLIEDTDVGATYRDLLVDYNPSWHVTWVKTIDELKKIDFLDRLHVFVFDQRLSNNELGTDAFQYIHGINPRIQGIMLSGVAMAKDLEIAQKIAGKRIHHLVKDDVLQLPELVLEAISAYYTSIKRVSDNVDLTKKFSFRLFARKPKITLISHYVLDDNFLFDENWKVEARVRSGEDAKKIESITMSTKQTIVAEAISNIHIDSSLDVNQLKKVLTTHFEAKMSDELQEAYEYRSQKEHTYKLPEIPSSPTEDHPIEVRYEYNFIYRRVRAHLSIDCYTCGIKNYEDFDVFIPTGRIAWRQVAHYAIGGTRITPL